MINVEINPTRIILESRQFKSNVTFSLVELFFLLKHPLLRHGEKCVWLAIACLCTKEQELSCTFSYPQIATMVELKVDEVQAAIHRLKHMGFLKFNIDARSLIDCSLMFPLEGLLALKKAPKRVEIQENKSFQALSTLLVKTPLTRPEYRPTSPAKAVEGNYSPSGNLRSLNSSMSEANKFPLPFRERSASVACLGEAWPGEGSMIKRTHSGVQNNKVHEEESGSKSLFKNVLAFFSRKTMNHGI